MAKAGLGLIGLCDKGTLATTKTHAIGMGLKIGSSVKWNSYKDNETAYKQKLINKKNARVESESFQATMKMLSSLLIFAGSGCDAQIITSKQVSGAANGYVYKFAGDNALGLDFEGEISAAKRAMKIILESAFDQDTALSLIDAADSDTPVDMGFTNDQGIDYTLQRAPYFLSLHSPDLTSLVDKYSIIDRKLTFKTEGSKNEYNQTNIDFINWTLEITVRTNSVADQITFMNKARGLDVVMKEKTSGAYYDCFNFGENVLTKTDEATIDDKQNIFKMIYGASIPLFDHVVEFGTGKGGAVDDTTGTTGGTILIGHE